jgi:hypothetical protein
MKKNALPSSSVPFRPAGDCAKRPRRQFQVALFVGKRTVFSLRQELKMRRAFAIVLSLLFCLGPLSGLLPGSSESRLPACCRRHGSHHCAMSADSMAMRMQSASGSAPSLVAPSRCPFFPVPSAVPASTTLALTAPLAALPVQLAQTLVPPASRAAVLSNQVRTHAGRAPPLPRLV